MILQHATLTADALRPGDDGYDTAARTFFATGNPALVVRPREPEEVAAALAYAARHDLAVSVRSGGHSPLGHSTNTGGMVIDLAQLDDVEVLDTQRRLVRVGGGATWGGWRQRSIRTAGPSPPATPRTSASAVSPWAAASAGWFAGTGWRSTTWSARAS